MGPVHPSSTQPVSPETIYAAEGRARSLRTLGRLEEALELRKSAIEVARRRGDPPNMLSGFIGSLGALHILMGNDREAWEQLSIAIRSDFEIHDAYAPTAAEWEGSLNAATKDWYIEMGMGIALRVDDPEIHRQVFECLLSWKGRVGRRLAGLRAAVRSASAEDPAPVLEALRATQSALSIAVHDSTSRADQEALLERRSRQERELLTGVGAVAVMGEIDTTVPEIQALLEPGTLALDFFVYDDYGPFDQRHPDSSRGFGMRPKRVVAWVLGHEGPPRPVDLGEMTALEQAVEDYLELIAVSGSSMRGVSLSLPADDDPSEPGMRLHDLLWKPIAAHFEQVERVLVSTDRFLGRLPLEVLPTEGGGFLIERLAFVYQPSLASLPWTLSLVDEGSRAGGLLSVGGVDYGEGPRWRALRATGPEAAEVATSARDFLEVPVTELQGQQAGVPRFLAALPGRRWIHVATHGFFAPATSATGPRNARVARLMPGLFTGLVFAGANESPAGLLTAEQVSWTDLSGCELVVLSACGTGLGERRSADELVSLQRAFRLAGAQTIVSSLWGVDDASTRELMAAFYTNLWEGGLPRHEALRRAQLSMLRRDRENEVFAPSRWGAFVLSGDWR